MGDMSYVNAIVSGVAIESWRILVESAPYFLFGFAMAAVIKALIPESAVVRSLGARSFGSVLKASLLGIPLPLCSCGVIPVAIGIKKQGASNGATTAFLISTPESGVDSMAITWALLDPIMTVMRPIAAFITATAAGALVNLLPENSSAASVPSSAHAGCCCECGHDSCCDGGAPSRPGGGDDEAAVLRPGLARRLGEGFSYAFGGLIGDIGGWLLAGVVVAGAISYFMPDDFFHHYMGNEYISLLVMLLVGIPIYICASASTPIAAAMVLKGLSPGAALVLLLAGPATNAATLTVIARIMGARATTVYMGSIAVCSLVMGWLVNRVYAMLGPGMLHWSADAGEAAPGWISVGLAVLMVALILRSLIPLPWKKQAKCECGV